MQSRVYLDHNATTPVHPEVIEAVGRALSEEFGNASSVHAFGQRAKIQLDQARAEVAALVGGEPAEIVFTSGGTEAINLALRGLAERAPAGRRHFVVSAIEHEAVLNTVKALARQGWSTTLVPPDASGVVAIDRVAAAINDETALVSVMHANNEIGTVQPVAEIAALAHARGALVHTDAVQSVGKIPVDVQALGVDLLALSGHKFNGPKGTGALWVRRGTPLAAVMTGGRQERGRRAGTENVPALIGLGVAARLARTKPGREPQRLAALRDALETRVLDSVPRTEINGDRSRRVPGTTSISFDGVEAESLLIALDLEGIAASTGSACSSGTLEPSHVLKAMGFPPHRAQSSIRFSLGLDSTEADVDRLLAVLPDAVERLRSLTRVATRR